MNTPRKFTKPAEQIAREGPSEFRRIAERMHVDFELDLDLSDEGALIDYFAADVSRHDARIAADYIDELLASGENRRKLLKIWNAASARVSDGAVSFRANRFDVFLQKLRDRLRRP